MNRAKAFILALLVVTAAVSFVLLVPFLEYVLAAIIVAYVLYPLHRRLVPRVGSFVSAISLIGASIVVIVIPFLYVFSVFVRDLRAIATGDTGLETELIEARIRDVTGVEVEIGDLLGQSGQLLFEFLFGSISGLFTMLLHLSIGIALMLFLVFYLLRDGAAFIAWIRMTMPLPRPVADRLFLRIHRTTWGAVIGHAFAAFVQALVAGLGLYLVGIPNVAFWTFVMAILAFLPLIGVFLIWAPAAAYLVIIEEPVAGVLLAVYGFTVVSMIDYYARPLVIDHQARLNPGVILIGVFGGIYTLGFVGLFVGPIVIGVLVAVLETFQHDYDRL